ncbi:cellulase family glycosylhydrolase [Streptomyces zhihengii]|uniref:Cellulase family glycosylhydrolase n=1 Tax=Streptomyces zhihengii TaxID=1818004 RepID=A0ABS2UWZ0_9ACTN|nr:cellulase family glycosylhydrolase [Streptomyces zhihengii]MBM9622022.1 cellulase family glycosylhydrolase [Streptomyces zhihengii]
MAPWSPRRPRRLALAAAIAVAACALALQPAPPAPPPLRTGIAYGNTLVSMPDAELAAALDDVVSLGGGWVRADLAWRDVQADGPDAYRWHLFDRVVEAARARDLEVLPVLAYTPPWARPDGCASDKCAPADPAAFAAFAGAAAARYAQRGVHIWEIWNEPNLVRFWQPAPDPAAYAVLLREAGRALRAADPAARVVLGGLGAAPSGGGDIAQTEFLAEVCERGGNRLVDAVGYHPYTYPDLTAVAGHTTAWDAVAGGPDSLEGVLAAYGTPGLPVWITETGAPTGGPGTASDGSPAASGPAATHVTEARQAAVAADVVRAAAADPVVGALFWYSDRDLGTDRSTNEDFYGLRRSDGSPKPALGALRRAIGALRD